MRSSSPTTNRDLRNADKQDQGLRTPAWFGVIFGVFLGVTLLKFGNPPIMEKYVTPPANVYEVMFGYPWPIGWGYGVLALVAVIGFGFVRAKPRGPVWLVVLPLVWVGWEIFSSLFSVDPLLSKPTVKHFVACAVCFYIGVYCLAGLRSLWPLWAGVLCGFLLVLAFGWEQRFGGLKATREYFFMYVYPGMKEVPPEYMKKMSSDRIFGTLFYPNALAGLVLLLLPGLSTALLSVRRLTPAARVFSATVIGAASLACLYWSGSKGGWVLMLVLGLIVLFRLPLSKKVKLAVGIIALVAGLGGLVAKHAGYFHQGATSVGARFDYWRAAVQTAAEHPLVGTGPGTFSIPYQKVKRPEAEMSRLVHNDYLEQATDSGLPGFLAYSAFVIGSLWTGFRQLSPRSAWSSPFKAENARVWATFGVWLGLLGFALQGTVEFGLYLPALAWPAFTLLGWLVGNGGFGLKTHVNVNG